MNLVSRGNPSWFKDKATSSIWIRGYRMMRVPGEQLKGIETLDLGEIRAIFFRGTFTYLDTSTPAPKTGYENVIHLGSMSVATAPKDTYLILLAPHVIDGRAGSEQRTRDLISSAAGFLSLLSGQNIVYAHLFDNIVKADGTGRSAWSKGIIVPTTRPNTDLSEEPLKRIKTACDALEALPDAERHRVQLSLRWFNKSSGIGGIDEFVSRWISLETLAMPDTTNIRPANEALARAYQVTRELAANKFLLGQLFDLRSRIVHNGESPPLHSKLLDYLSALYQDIFNEILKLPCEKSAEAALTADGEIILDALDEAKKKRRV